MSPEDQAQLAAALDLALPRSKLSAHRYEARANMTGIGRENKGYVQAKHDDGTLATRMRDLNLASRAAKRHAERDEEHAARKAARKERPHQSNTSKNAIVRSSSNDKQYSSAMDVEEGNFNTQTAHKEPVPYYLPQTTYKPANNPNINLHNNDVSYIANSLGRDGSRNSRHSIASQSRQRNVSNGSNDTTSPMEAHHIERSASIVRPKSNISSHPGEPDYNPALLAAMKNCPDITPDIWIKIYRSHVGHQLQSLTEFLYGSPACSGTILGTPDEPYFRAQIAYLEGEMVKVNHKVSQLCGTVGDRVRAEQKRKEEERAKQLAYDEETDRRISERAWRKMEGQRLADHRRFKQEKRSTNELINAEKAKEINDFYDAQIAIEYEEGKLANEAALGARELQIDAQVRAQAAAMEQAAREQAYEEDWQAVKARWEWMVADMTARQVGHADIAEQYQIQQQQGMSQAQQQIVQERGEMHRARDVGRDTTVEFDLYHQMRAQERHEVRYYQQEGPKKGSKGMGRVWNFVKHRKA